MKDEINCSYNGGGDAYSLQSVATHFNHTVRDILGWTKPLTKFPILTQLPLLHAHGPWFF